MDSAQDDSTCQAPRRFVVCLVADGHVIENFPAAVRYLLVGLIDEPIDTILVLPEHSRAETLTRGPTAVITHRDPQWPLARWARRDLITRVRRQIEAFQNDAAVIVHCLAPSIAPLAADLADAVGADLVLTLAPSAERDLPNLASHIQKAAVVIAPSHAAHRAVMASPWGAALAPHLPERSPRPVEVIQFGAVAGTAPAAFNSPQLSPALVFAGVLTVDCGADCLLRAAKRVLQHHPNLLIFIIGKGPAENRLRHLVETLDIRPAVTFTGRLDHWQHALEAADIFCLPRANAVFREEPIHAFAAGLAVVASEDGCFDGLIDRQTALLFPDGDEVRLAEQIRRFLDDPEFARSVAAAAQAHARSDNSVSRMVAEHVRVYSQLATRGSTFSMLDSR